jgi:RNA polymerase sigma-70 factor (ECF subfamily)
MKKSSQNEIIQLYKLRKQDMILYSYAICKDFKMAEDVIHDIFVTLLLKKDFMNIRDLSSYSFRCVKWNTYRKIKVSRSHNLDIDTDRAQLKKYVCSNEKSYDFLQEKIIMDAIESLPMKRRAVFRMKRIENRSIKNISLELSISAKTVENHITNAIKDLKGKLGVMRNC